jgi:signal transduction histidine kinase
MGSGATSAQQLLELLDSISITPWLGRTGLILVPLHVVAFLVLYLSAFSIVEREIIHAHGDSAHVFANHVVRELHPVMVTSGAEDIRNGIEELANAHDLLHLQLFDASGAALTPPTEADLLQPVEEFLSSGETARFDLARTSTGWNLHGMVEIDATGGCADCHGAAEIVGVAAMSYELTPYIRSARHRLRYSLAVLLGGWVVVMTVITFSTRRLVTRSMTRLRADLHDAEVPGRELRSVSKLVVDPVSAELLAALREMVDNQKQRERNIASRLQHSDRLASLGQLAAGLAHEIKNPVAGIQGVLEILRDEESDDSRRELFERLIGETRRINETVQELLHFARPGTPRKAAIDVTELLEDIVQLLAAGFARRGISINRSVASDLPQCLLDPAQIRQVLVNLVNNAGEAMESGGSIEIRASEFPGDGGLILAVEDDGPGIAPEDVDKIFEPFHTTKVHGTGLGLAVARTLVAQHGGTIEVDSVVGRGSTFFVILPHDPGAGIDASRDNG